MADTLDSAAALRSIARPTRDVAHDAAGVGGVVQLGRDVVALTKPSITAMAMIVGAGAMFLARGTIAPLDAIWSVAGIGLAVAGAGSLNMWVERDVDALMERTATRPLPAGRLSSIWALLVGFNCELIALPMLYRHAGVLSCALTAFSLFVYVLVYTPMKRTSPWALIVGAVPGAMPALMGSAAVTHGFDVVGVALFFWVFLWQVPHFIAIGIYREREYARAGHRIVTTAVGASAAKAMLALSAALLAVCGVLLVPLHVGGVVTAAVAVAAGAWFVFLSVRNVLMPDAWSRKVFFASLLYQTALFGALVVDALIARLA
jgi:protoheme IX farnesyltransferase